MVWLSRQHSGFWSSRSASAKVCIRKRLVHLNQHGGAIHSCRILFGVLFTRLFQEGKGGKGEVLLEQGHSRSPLRGRHQLSAVILVTLPGGVWQPLAALSSVIHQPKTAGDNLSSRSCTPSCPWAFQSNPRATQMLKYRAIHSTWLQSGLGVKELIL